MRNILLIISLLSFVSIGKLFSQDAEFSQFYANSAYLNPAFVGNTKCPTMTMSYRSQWTALSGNYSTAIAAYEQNSNTLRGGVGIILFNDESSTNLLSTNTISALYSNQQQLSRNLYIRMGLQTTYNQKNINWDNLTFPDQIDPSLGFIYQTQQPIIGGVARYVDFSSGLVLYSDKAFIGFAAHHMNEPNETVTFGGSYLPAKYTVHGGVTLPLYKVRNEVISTISPNLMYRQQGEFKQLNMGLYVDKDPLTFGLWYRGWLGENYRDALIGYVGVKMEKFHFGYSYDFTVSELIGNSGGTHEISLRLNLNCNNYKQKHKPIPCASFYNP